jgi:hypothetical protein
MVFGLLNFVTRTSLAINTLTHVHPQNLYWIIDIRSLIDLIDDTFLIDLTDDTLFAGF